MVRVPNCPMASGCQVPALAKTVWKSSEPNARKSRNIPSMKPKSPMRLTMNAFLPASAADFLQEVETDQQVAAQAHAFPADEEKHEIGGENQNQHEEHEQIQVGEEAVVAAFMRHVARGVDVDQEADAGDDQHHHDGELVQLQIESRAEISGNDPIEELLAERRLATGEEFAHGFQRAGKGEARGAQRNAGDELVGPLRAQQAVDG